MGLISKIFGCHNSHHTKTFKVCAEWNCLYVKIFRPKIILSQPPRCGLSSGDDEKVSKLLVVEITCPQMHWICFCQFVHKKLFCQCICGREISLVEGFLNILLVIEDSYEVDGCHKKTFIWVSSMVFKFWWYFIDPQHTNVGLKQQVEEIFVGWSWRLMSDNSYQDLC